MADALILLHGRGGSGEDIAPVAQYLGITENIATPTAPGNQWYPYSFTRPLADNAPGLRTAIECIDKQIAAFERQGISREHIILTGFSQGACLALHYALLRPARYRAILAFSGGVPGTDAEVNEQNNSVDLHDTPVFLGCAANDPFIPETRVRHSAAIFQKAHANVTVRIYPDALHTIRPDEIAVAKQILAN